MEKQIQDETQFAMAVHDLLLTLGSEGIVLVQLPEQDAARQKDIVDCLRISGERFANAQGLTNSGLLLRYLADHLYEIVPGGIKQV